MRITYVPPMLSSKDQTWVISGAMYWSVIETNVGILASSIPSFKPIITRIAPRLLGSSNNTAKESTTRRSGFHMMPLGSHGGADGHDDPGSSKARKGALETHIRGGYDENSSEEDLVIQGGQIMVKTEIRHK